MENCKGVTTPINPKEKLSKEMCPKTEEEKKAVEKLPYQSLVGSLMYLLSCFNATRHRTHREQDQPI
jgi:hypothetical protein